MKLIPIFILGVSILIGAIILNIIASKFGLLSWFDFLNNTKEANAISYIWLFILYPFGLGLITYIALKFINL